MYNDYIYCCCCLVSKSCPFFCDLMDNQATLSMEFSRQEYRSGLPFPPTGHLPNPGIKPVSLVSPAVAGWFFTSWATGDAPPWAMATKDKARRTLLQGGICFLILGFLVCTQGGISHSSGFRLLQPHTYFRSLMSLRMPWDPWPLNHSV